MTKEDLGKHLEHIRTMRLTPQEAIDYLWPPIKVALKEEKIKGRQDGRQDVYNNIAEIPTYKNAWNAAMDKAAKLAKQWSKGSGYPNVNLVLALEGAKR